MLSALTPLGGATRTAALVLAGAKRPRLPRRVRDGRTSLAGASAAVICNHHGLGGAGAAELGQAVVEACGQPSSFKFLYDVNLSIKASVCGGW